MQGIQIFVAHEGHTQYAAEICAMMEESARIRGTGIAKRSPDYLVSKMLEGKAVIALAGEAFVGFCYIETWSHGQYVANSGLIVNPEFRSTGVARNIKAKVFELSRKKYPDAKIFGITTSLPVMKINSELGYKPVPFSELTQDDVFWKGCQSCINFDILTRTERKHCLCTGMLFDPKEKDQQKENKSKWRKFKVYERWLRFKQHVLIRVQETKQKRQEKKEQKRSRAGSGGVLSLRERLRLF
ncbi:N-acetyltransferase [Eisenibacter elegans]|jgi:hypothetical protein|uniref:N-acetyltransferase n=1 Tax=Eisenibacter elegans TaxID=997 RepID=UPI00041991F7|nr:N-acetyltransferase [Eisenibacter elegans]